MKPLASCLMAIGVLAGSASQAAGIRVAGVDHVGINVPDLMQAEAFFDSAFGSQASRAVSKNTTVLPSPFSSPSLSLPHRSGT